ncbi:MAG: hypothetical protein QOF88_2816 [Mycobacterium sp.]|jgi:hypothetical protein|nr:hypothetical protein [Mycobacterium sp.]
MAVWDGIIEPDDEQGRQAMAQLLQSRGEDVAAAIVAVSTYESVLVDNWNGGQYEGVLAVPPQLYDVARSECVEALDAACSSLIGSDCYRGLNVTLKRSQTDPAWVAKVLAALRPQWVSSERSDMPPLSAAAT